MLIELQSSDFLSRSKNPLMKHGGKWQPTDSTGPAIVKVDSDSKKDAASIEASLKKHSTTAYMEVANILTSRTFDQRQEIAQSFVAQFNGKNLSSAISETDWKFKSFLVRLTYTRDELLATDIWQSLQKNIKNQAEDDAFISILGRMTGKELQSVADTYKKLFNTEIKNDMGATSYPKSGKQLVEDMFDFSRYNRPEDKTTFDKEDAFTIGGVMPRTGGHCSNLKNTKLKDFMIGSSFEKIGYVFDRWDSAGDGNLEALFKQNCGEGTTKKFYMVMIHYAQLRTRYQSFAYDLNNGLDNIDINEDENKGNDYDAAMRTIISRSEIDLLDVMSEFNKQSYQTGRAIPDEQKPFDEAWRKMAAGNHH